jgi:hypothetical protein
VIEALILLLFALAVVPLVVWGVVSSGVHWTRERRRQRVGSVSVRIRVDMGPFMAAMRRAGTSASFFAETMGKVQEASRRAAEEMTALRLTASAPLADGFTSLRGGPQHPWFDPNYRVVSVPTDSMLGNLLVGRFPDGLPVVPSWYCERNMMLKVDRVIFMHPFALAQLQSTGPLDRLRRVTDIVIERAHERLDAVIARLEAESEADR